MTTMVRKRSLEGRGKELAHCELTPQTTWLTAESLTKRGRQKTHAI